MAAWRQGRGESSAPASLAAARWSQLALVSSPLVDRRALSGRQRQQHAASAAAPPGSLLDSQSNLAGAGNALDKRLANFSSFESGGAERGDGMGVKLVSLQSASAQFPGGHPHNRIQLRQAGGRHQYHGQAGNHDDTVGQELPFAAKFRGDLLTTTTTTTTNALGGSSAGLADDSESDASSANLASANININESGGANEQSAAAAAAATASKAAPPPPPPDSKAYVTVKQTAINLYTYRLRMTISRMQLEDYGEYSCISSNSMGASESSITVTSAYQMLGPLARSLLHAENCLANS